MKRHFQPSNFSKIARAQVGVTRAQRELTGNLSCHRIPDLSVRPGTWVTLRSRYMGNTDKLYWMYLDSDLSWCSTWVVISDDQIEWLGRVPYDTSLTRMEEIRERILGGDPGAARVLLTEHSPVITMGRHARPENIVLSPATLREEGIELREIRRGGDVTYHGPGQLMVYLIVKIDGTIGEFLRTIAGALTSAASSYGAHGACWRDDPAGLWFQERKLAACGLHIRRRVCIHGFTFNLATPATAWNAIVPCGLAGPPPISLADIIGQENTPSTEEFAKQCRPLLGAALRGFGA